MTGLALVSTTTATMQEAKDIARRLVRAKLAACVQIVPGTSVYAWRGAVEEAGEWMLTCKIRGGDYPAVEAAILAAHSYDTPEVVTTPISGGSEAYLAWIEAATDR